MRRVMAPERMDEPDVPRAELDRAFGFIRLVNRRLGGAGALIRRLSRWSPLWPKASPVTLLDVATGSADIPVLAVRWARSRGFDLRVTGVDIHETALDLAREHLARNPAEAGAVDLLTADALAMDGRFAERAFDYAHAGMFLHHLSEGQTIAVLKSMDRVSRRGLVWNELMRSPIALAAIHALTLPGPAIVRHDAVASVRKGFTRHEALALAHRAGLGWCRYEPSFLAQRFTLAGERPGAWRT